MTFREAYNRTGRILNISVVPADRHSYVFSPCVVSVAATETAVQPDEAVKLYDGAGYDNLERALGICSCSRHPEPCRPDAEAEGWDRHSVELGKQVQGRISEVRYRRFLPSSLADSGDRVDITVQALNLYFNGGYATGSG